MTTRRRLEISDCGLETAGLSGRRPERLRGGSVAALACSAAVAVHLSARHLPLQRQPGSVDFAPTNTVVSARVTTDVPVSHFHLPPPRYSKFLVQLVDPVSRLRVDIFPDTAGSIHRSAVLPISNNRVRVLDPDPILDHKLATLARASEQRP